ncbi:hypothetical protein K525DRAFT_191000, partial [Schizophyllum commune Loenen D]
SFTDGDVIVFRSADGTLFNVHRRNLQSTTDGPLAEDFPATPGDIVQPIEDASTLETLFAFVYPGVYPSLKDMPVEDFVKVADAAEKYRVAPAVAVCGLIIENREIYREYPLLVIAYADRHGHWELLDRAAVCSLDCAVVEARKALSIASFAAWMEYRDAHLSALRDECDGLRFRTSHRLRSLPAGSECLSWANIVLAVEKRLSEEGKRMLLDPNSLFDGLSGCTTWIQGRTSMGCTPQLEGWKTVFEKKLAAVPPLSKLISGRV